MDGVPLRLSKLVEATEGIVSDAEVLEMILENIRKVM